MTSTFHTHKEQYVNCVSLRGIYELQRLPHFKTVHNALVRSGSHNNCPFKYKSFTVAYTINHLPIGGFVAIYALTEVVRLIMDRFKSLSDTGVPLSTAEQSSPVPEQKLFQNYCF